ncbi:MAG: PIG-L family deacetylase [Nitrospirae bacterium]|nr:PIG-L family deacetylase [Nitrospirota bacterium]
MKNILVVAAHPDDEVLGCGGTMARLAAEGSDVYTLILGEGATARDGSRMRQKREKDIAGLKKQSIKAGKILGVKKTFSFDFPDNRFDTAALLDIVKAVEKIKKEIYPDIVFTHHKGDLNVDHRLTFEAVLTAFRPVKGERARAIYSFEVPSSTEWSAPSHENYFMPNHFVDISKTLAKKIRALKEYKAELREFPHPRSVEAVELYARRWGVSAGLGPSEAFQVIRQII